MEKAAIADFSRTEQDERISEAVERERSRLRNFIRSRVPDGEEVEDILQDVFAELVETYRLMKPVEQVGAWLFRVARNRITDLFRRKRPERMGDQAAESDDEDTLFLRDRSPSPGPSPSDALARTLLTNEIERAIGGLPEEQRFIFVAHELDGVSFKELSAQTGLSVNTLLSRKHYAVAKLRQKLQSVYDELEGISKG